jgi:CheY-like chemotaxis protein
MTAASRPTAPVMIVEDDFDVRTLFADSLSEAGYEVETASNGREALELLRAGQVPVPGVILLDLMMPIMDGWKMREELLADPALHAIPVVMMTASRGIGGGPDDVLLKPFPLEALLATVERYCGPAPG